jgi:hypothetical protein
MKNIKVKRHENQFINGKTKFVQNAQHVTFLVNEQ